MRDMVFLLLFGLLFVVEVTTVVPREYLLYIFVVVG